MEESNSDLLKKKMKTNLGKDRSTGVKELGRRVLKSGGVKHRAEEAKNRFGPSSNYHSRGEHTSRGGGELGKGSGAQGLSGGDTKFFGLHGAYHQ